MLYLLCEIIYQIKQFAFSEIINSTYKLHKLYKHGTDMYFYFFTYDIIF